MIEIINNVENNAIQFPYIIMLGESKQYLTEKAFKELKRKINNHNKGGK